MTALSEFAQRAYAHHDEAHNYQHALAVFTNAREIAKDTWFILSVAERKEFEYIMIGHDFRDHKLIAMGIGLSEEEIEAFYVRELGVEAAARVKHIHANCSWSNRKTSVALPFMFEWMRTVLQDADWIEAINLNRCIAFTKFTKPEASADEVRELVRQHIREKLLNIAPELNHDVSRRLVTSRGLEQPLRDYLID